MSEDMTLLTNQELKFRISRNQLEQMRIFEDCPKLRSLELERSRLDAEQDRRRAQ